MPAHGLGQGPGSYYVEGHRSIQQRQLARTQQADLREQQRQHIQRVEELNAKLLPSV